MRVRAGRSDDRWIRRARRPCDGGAGRPGDRTAPTTADTSGPGQYAEPEGITGADPSITTGTMTRIAAAARRSGGTRRGWRTYRWRSDGTTGTPSAAAPAPWSAAASPPRRAYDRHHIGRGGRRLIGSAVGEIAVRGKSPDGTNANAGRFGYNNIQGETIMRTFILASQR